MIQSLLATLSFVFLFTACTSEEGKLDELAVTTATQDFQMELKTEIAKAVNGKSKLQFTAVDIITKKTEFVIANKNVKDLNADYEIQAKTIPVKVRTNLIAIMAELDDSKEPRFNVSNALQLIYQNLNIATDAYSTQTYKLKFKKAGTWSKQD